MQVSGDSDCLWTEGFDRKVKKWFVRDLMGFEGFWEI